MIKLQWLLLLIPCASYAQADRLFGKGVSIEEVYSELNERICRGDVILLKGLDTTFQSSVDSIVSFKVRVTETSIVRTVFIRSDKIFEATFNRRQFTLEAYSNKVTGTRNRNGYIKNLKLDVDGCVLAARKVRHSFKILSENNCGEPAARNESLVDFVSKRAQMFIDTSKCN